MADGPMPPSVVGGMVWVAGAFPLCMAVGAMWVVGALPAYVAGGTMCVEGCCAPTQQPLKNIISSNKIIFCF